MNKEETPGKGNAEAGGEAAGEPKGRKHKGRVMIKQALCKGCGFCVGFCPRHTLVMSKSLNDKSYHYPEVDKDNCTGCDLCGMLCPDFAIYGFRVKVFEE